MLECTLQRNTRPHRHWNHVLSNYCGEVRKRHIALVQPVQAGGVEQYFCSCLLGCVWGRDYSHGKRTSLNDRHNIYSTENVHLTSSAGCPLLGQFQENLSSNTLHSAFLAGWGCHPLFRLCWLFSTYLLTLFHPT